MARAQVIQLRRTTTPNKPPAVLAEGELAAGIVDRPIRMWIGTPSGVEELLLGGGAGGGPGGAVISPTPPTNPDRGTFWFDETSGQTFVWTGAQWVIVVNAEPGPPGQQGIPGEAATLELGTVTTGEPGSPAEIIERGTPQARIFDFTLPRGERGAQGNPGGNWDSALILHDPTTLRMTPGFVKINGVMHVMPEDIFTDAEVEGVPGAALAPNTTYLVFAKHEADQIVASFRSGVGHRTSTAEDNEGIEVLAPLTGEADPLWRNVVLLITDSFADRSSWRRSTFESPLAGANPPTIISTPEQPPDGTLENVINFPGPGWGRILVNNGTSFNFGSLDFCIEAYIRPIRSNALQALFWDGSQVAFGSYISAANQLIAQFAGWGAGWNFAANTWGTIIQNEWQHIAIFRRGVFLYGAHNGVVTRIGDLSPWTQPVHLGVASAALRIGVHQDASSWPFQGQMTGIRFTRGDSRYGPENFTPPSLPYPITDRRLIGAEDPRESLIGIVRTDAAAQFADEPKRRNVRSWRRDQERRLFNQYTAERSRYWQWWGEVHPEIRIEWVSFEDEPIDFQFQSAILAGGGQYAGLGFGVDTVSLPLVPEPVQYVHNSYWNWFTMRNVSQFAEGHHVATVMNCTTSNSWTYFGVPAAFPWNLGSNLEAMPALSALIAPRP